MPKRNVTKLEQMLFTCKIPHLLGENSTDLLNNIFLHFSIIMFKITKDKHKTCMFAPTKLLSRSRSNFKVSGSDLSVDKV